MTKSLPKIDGTEQLRLARSGLIRDAEALLREITRSLGGLNSASIVALAASRHPNLPAEQAFHILRGDVAELIRALESSGADLQAALDVERKRLAVVVAAAAHRSIEIAGAADGIAAAIRSSQSLAESKRERLRKAGLTGDDLARATAPFDPSELQARRAVLLGEQDALEAFLKTRDTVHLPVGFAEKVREAT